MKQGHQTLFKSITPRTMPLPSNHRNYQDPLSRSGHKPKSTVKFFPSLLFLPPKHRSNRLLHSPPPLPYFHLITELRICYLQLLSISVFKRFCIKLLSHKWQLFPPPGEESNRVEDGTEHTRAFQQEQEAQDVNLLHVVWVLGLPRRTRLTQTTEGTMLYLHREKTAQDWLESAGPSAPAGLALELMRRQSARTLPVLQVKDPRGTDAAVGPVRCQTTAHQTQNRERYCQRDTSSTGCEGSYLFGENKRTNK